MSFGDRSMITYIDQNYPNPFNPSTTISFGMHQAGPVDLRVYDAAGRLVRVLVDEQREAAVYNENWDGRDDTGVSVASGVYFYKLKTKTFKETKKMVLLR